jgi:hypothetical protein
VALLAGAAAGAGCSLGGHEDSDKAAASGPVRDPAVRSSAETQIRRRVVADMRAHATPVDGPPFRVKASCLTQTGSGSSYRLACRATGYERPRAFRDISGVPTSHRVASETWSVGVRKARVSTLTRGRGKSIGQLMFEAYNSLCGDGSSSSGDPACN